MREYTFRLALSALYIEESGHSTSRGPNPSMYSARGPNHHDRGALMAISRGTWETASASRAEFGQNASGDSAGFLTHRARRGVVALYIYRALGESWGALEDGVSPPVGPQCQYKGPRAPFHGVRCTSMTRTRTRAYVDTNMTPYAYTRARRYRYDRTPRMTLSRRPHFSRIPQNSAKPVGSQPGTPRIGVPETPPE